MSRSRDRAQGTGPLLFARLIESRPGISSAIFRFGTASLTANAEQFQQEKNVESHTKTDVVVLVVWIVPVAVRAAHVVMIVDVGTAPNNTLISSLPLFLFVCGFLPSAKQAANFRNHDCHMLILAIAQPVPAMRKSDIDSYSRQCFICERQ